MAVKSDTLWGSATLALAVAALAVPATASAQDRGWGRVHDRGQQQSETRQSGGDRQESRGSASRSQENRSGGGERPAWGGRNDQSRGNGGEARAWGRNGGNPASNGQGESRGWAGRSGAQQPVVTPAPQPGTRWGRGSAPVVRDNNRGDQSRVRDWAGRVGDGRRDGTVIDRNRDGRRDGSWNDRDRDGRRDGSWTDRNRDGRRDGTWTNRNGSWTRDGDRYRSGGDHRNWDRRWRDNTRYNWYTYRRTNPSIFRWGSYYSPYRNYSYRRLSVGFYLDSLFYGSRYWINDPWQYRLPDVYGPYRWVRYYDDALLVNVYDGEVVDVIHDFFW